MAPLAAVWFLVLAWTCVNLFRVALGMFWPATLHRLQQQHGITIGALSVTWHTQYFNRWFNSFVPKRALGKCQYSWYCGYFTVGVWLTMAMFPYAMYTIIRSLVQSSELVEHVSSLFGSSDAAKQAAGRPSPKDASNSNSGLMIVIPGVSIPYHECFYFFLAVAISSVIHELGHAMAANRHKLKIDSVGISLFVCLPVTFVSMQETKQLKHGTFGRLEIVSAGLLNNAVLCAVTLLCFICNPLVLLYTATNGLIVTSVDPLSSISSGPNGLMPHDIIKSINSRPVTDLNSWNANLNAIYAHQSGLCVPYEFIEKHRASISAPCALDECCQHDGRNLCFVMHSILPDQLDDDDDYHVTKCDLDSQFATSNLKHYYESTQKADRMRSTHNNNFNQFDAESNFVQSHRKVCLPARKVTELASQFCNDSSACVQTYFGGHSCLWPYSSQPLTRLIVIEVEDKPSNILFWGPPAELYQALALSAIKPRVPLMPITTYEQLNVFYRYLFSISFSLILFNLLPYDPFDGYHIVSLTSLYLFRNVQENVRQRVLRLANLVATVLMLLCVLVGLVQLRQFVGREM